MGLNKHRASLRIESSGMPISDKEEALILVLHANPVIQGAHEVAQMQPAGGTHAAQNPLPLLISASHYVFRMSKSKARSTGSRSLLKSGPPKTKSSISPNIPIMSYARRIGSGRKWRSTRKPYNGRGGV